MGKRWDAVIIGGGPGGMTAAIWCRRLGIEAILLEASSSLGGQLKAIDKEIKDYPGINSINGQDLARRFQEHLERMDCPWETQRAVVEIQREGKTVVCRERTYETSYVIMATGAKARCLGIPGEDELVGRGEIYSASRDRLKFRGKGVAVIGGGDRALEAAWNLAEGGARVLVLHRHHRFKARRDFVRRAYDHPGIQIITHARVKEILGVSRVEALRADIHGRQQVLPVEGVFVRIGVEPNSDLLKGLVDLDDEGYIMTKARGQTSLPWLYAIGDVNNPPAYSGVPAAVGQGMLAVKDISQKMEKYKK